MPGQDEFVDQSAGQAGTALTSGVLDALVVAQSSLYVYTTPTLSATLSQPIPAAEVIFNHGDNTALKVAIAASTIGLAASSDNYIDAQPAGAWVLAGSVTVGNAAPALTAGNVRVWKITTGASAPTAVTLLAPTQPLNATQMSADATEAATNDALTAASTLTTNLNRLRYQLAQLGTGAWSSLRAMVQLSPASAQTGNINVTGSVTASQVLSVATGSGVTASGGTAGLGSGGSYAAPTVQAGSTPQRGRVTFTTGANPGGGAGLTVVTLGATFPNGGVVIIQPAWFDPSGYTIAEQVISSTAYGGAYPQYSGPGTALSSFQVNVRNALRPNTGYIFDYWVIG